MTRFEVIETTEGIGIIDNELKDAETDGILTNGFSRKASAKVICDAMNELQEEIKAKPLNLHKDFQEWSNCIKWLNKTGRRLTEIDEIYQEEFKIELANALEIGVDFKKIYGGNTEKTRKQYVDEQLSDLIDEKNELKALQSDDLRRIEFLKRLVDMKIKLIDQEYTSIQFKGGIE